MNIKEVRNNTRHSLTIFLQKDVLIIQGGITKKLKSIGDDVIYLE